MPHKNIPGALDENFIMDAMTLILLDPVAGFILAEQIEEKRGESLPQINIAMLFGEKTRLPVYFKCLPGSIKDVSALQNF